MCSKENLQLILFYISRVNGNKGKWQNKDKWKTKLLFRYISSCVWFHFVLLRHDLAMQAKFYCQLYIQYGLLHSCRSLHVPWQQNLGKHLPNHLGFLVCSVFKQETPLMAFSVQFLLFQTDLDFYKLKSLASEALSPEYFSYQLKAKPEVSLTRLQLLFPCLFFCNFKLLHSLFIIKLNNFH